MSAKNNTQVIIAGKIFTESGIVSEWKDFGIPEFGRVSQAFTGDAEHPVEFEYRR